MWIWIALSIALLVGVAMHFYRFGRAVGSAMGSSSGYTDEGMSWPEKWWDWMTLGLFNPPRSRGTRTMDNMHSE